MVQDLKETVSHFLVVSRSCDCDKTKSGHRNSWESHLWHTWSGQGVGTQQRVLEGEWCARMGSCGGQGVFRQGRPNIVKRRSQVCQNCAYVSSSKHLVEKDED